MFAQPAAGQWASRTVTVAGGALSGASWLGLDRWASWLEVGRVDRGRTQLRVLFGLRQLWVPVMGVCGWCGLKAFVWR